MTKPPPPKLCRSVSEASDLLKLIANPNRLSIVCLLMDEQHSVASLEQELGIRQPTLSQQLGELRDAGVIEGHRDGKSIIYQVVDHRAGKIVEVLRDIFSGLHDVTGRYAAPRAAPDDAMFD